MARDGVFVVRPDSTTLEDPTPGALVAHILESLALDFGTTTNEKGVKVLDPHVRVLWGDGIEEKGIQKIVNDAMLRGFSPENLVFGMGGGLLQKLNRDTQRFAFKSSAQKRNGEWFDIYKKPLDESKASKKGRLALVKGMGGFATKRLEDVNALYEPDELITVFEDGILKVNQTFEEIRERAAL
jgi:nicotinamide phosphoribosyltransferase